MQIITVQSIADRPLLTALANDDSLLIVDASDGNSVKKVALSVLKAFIGSSGTTPTPTPTPTPFVFRVNCGGNDYVDVNGKTWLADFGFSGGLTNSVSGEIANTLDDDLYRTERFETFHYQIAVTSGRSYTVKLLFCEGWYLNFEVGKRLARYKINGVTKLDNFDIFAEGGGMTALTKTFTVVADSNILVVSSEAIVENPSLRAIEILG